MIPDRRYCGLPFIYSLRHDFGASIRAHNTASVMFSRSKNYVSIAEEDETSLNDNLLPSYLPATPKHTFWSQYWAYFTHGALAVSCISFFCLWLHARQQSLTLPYCKSTEYGLFNL